MLYSMFPLTEVERIHENLDALMNHSAFNAIHHSFPLLNVYETADQIILRGELPGVKKEDVSIDFKEGTLTISGKKKSRECTEDTMILCKERSDGPFEKSVKISKKINDSAISASLKDGVLTILLSKAEEARPKTIEIN